MNYDINKLIDLPLRIQILIISVASLGLIGIGYEFMVSDLDKKITASKQNEVQLLGEYTSVMDKQMALKHHNLEIPQLKKMLTQSENKFITASEYGDLIDQILKLGSTYSLKFELFAPADKIKKEQFIVIPINIVMTGTYDQTARFMSAVANLSSTVKMSDFTMTNQTPEDTTANSSPAALSIDTSLKTKLTLEVYQLAI